MDIKREENVITIDIDCHQQYVLRLRVTCLRSLLRQPKHEMWKEDFIAMTSSSSSHPLNQYAHIYRISQRHRKRQDLHSFPLESRMVVMM